jgi:transposase
MVPRALGVTAATPSGRRDAFPAAGEADVATRPGTGEELAAERLKAKLGEAPIERDLLAEENRCPGGRPSFGPSEAEAMGREVSPVSGRPYGLAARGLPHLGHRTLDRLPAVGTAASGRPTTAPSSPRRSAPCGAPTRLPRSPARGRPRFSCRRPLPG